MRKVRRDANATRSVDAFAMLSLILAAIGVFAVPAHSVAQLPASRATRVAPAEALRADT